MSEHSKADPRECPGCQAERQGATHADGRWAAGHPNPLIRDAERDWYRREIRKAAGDDPPGAPYDLGVSPTGPLPRGWHRVLWEDVAGRPRHMITDDISSAALAEAAMSQSSSIRNVRMESWSDIENGERA